jgi:hypothetical protein
VSPGKDAIARGEGRLARGSLVSGSALTEMVRARGKQWAAREGNEVGQGKKFQPGGPIRILSPFSFLFYFLFMISISNSNMTQL